MTDRSIFTGVSGPSVDGGDPGSPIILGHIFQFSVTGWVKAIRWWRANTNINGVQKGRIFTVGSQTIVSGSAVDFPAPSGTGWQIATLSPAVQLSANTSYKVCVHFTDNYSATGGYWATGPGVGGRTDGPLTAPDAGGTPLGLGSIKQGSFAVTSNPDTYPDSYFNGGNYWVDLVITDVDPNAGQTINLGLPIETNDAFAVAVAKSLGLSLPVETDTAAALALGKAVDLALPASVDSALPAGLGKGALLGLPIELDTALAGVAGKELLLALPTEVDSGLALGLGKTTVLGLPGELDAALPMQGSATWPPRTLPPVNVRWASSGPPSTSRWATSGPPVQVTL